MQPQAENRLIEKACVAALMAALALASWILPVAPPPAAEVGRPAIRPPAPPHSGQALHREAAAGPLVDAGHSGPGLPLSGPAGAIRPTPWGRVSASAAVPSTSSGVPRHLLFCTWLV